jgi:glycosyltransferase involved in cell wall biosynthesis
MLDAFARELPVVAMSRATASLPVENACIVVPDDDPHALAAAAKRLLENDHTAIAIRKEALRYLATHHSVDSFAAAMRELVGEPEASPLATLPEPHRRVSRAPQAR